MYFHELWNIETHLPWLFEQRSNRLCSDGWRVTWCFNQPINTTTGTSISRIWGTIWRFLGVFVGCFKDVWSPCGNHHNTMQLFDCLFKDALDLFVIWMSSFVGNWCATPAFIYKNLVSDESWYPDRERQICFLIFDAWCMRKESNSTEIVFVKLGMFF